MLSQKWKKTKSFTFIPFLVTGNEMKQTSFPFAHIFLSNLPTKFTWFSTNSRRWSKIAAHFPGRTDNEIKNHWNTRIKKRLKQLGLDPLTHKKLTEKTDRLKEKLFIASNPFRKQEAIMPNFDFETKEINQVASHMISSDDGSSNLVCKGIGYEMWTDQLENDTNVSFSLEYCSSMNESLSIIKQNSIQFDSLDSLPSWDDGVPKFNQLEKDDIYSLGNGGGYYVDTFSH